MLRPVTIHLDEDTYKVLELRAAIDDLRIEQGIEAFLIEAVALWRERRQAA